MDKIVPLSIFTDLKDVFIGQKLEKIPFKLQYDDSMCYYYYENEGIRIEFYFNGKNELDRVYIMPLNYSNDKNKKREEYYIVLKEFYNKLKKYFIEYDKELYLNPEEGTGENRSIVLWQYNKIYYIFFFVSKHAYENQNKDTILPLFLSKYFVIRKYKEDKSSKSKYFIENFKKVKDGKEKELYFSDIDL